jgi:hypothetical protein
MLATVNTASGATPQVTPGQGGFRRLWRALKQLFHEVTGAVFALLALVWFSNAFRAWTRDVALWLIALAIIVAAIFAFLAVTSFHRAREV